MKLIRSTALAVMLGVAPPAFAQPSFPVTSEAPDLGLGLPDGKPIDIAGFYPGQNASEALANATTFYAAQGAKPPKPAEASLDFADSPFIWAIGPGGSLRPTNYDDIYALFSSNGSGNQLVALYRNVQYETGHPNTDATIQALFDKYGTPSNDGGDSFDFARLIEYGYLDGELKQDTNAVCPSLSGLNRFQPRSGQGADVMRRMLFQETGNNLNSYSPESRCDVYVRIQLTYGRENGTINPDIIGSMTMSLIDANRFEITNARDNAVQAELKELAVGTRSKGSGAPKL